MLSALKVDFFYLNVAQLHFPCSSEPNPNKLEWDVWQELTQHGKASALEMVDVTTKFPSKYDAVILASVTIVNDVGERVLRQGSGMLGMCIVPEHGCAWIAPHPSKLDAVNIFWCYASSPKSQQFKFRKYNLVFDLDVPFLSLKPSSS